MLPSLVPSPPLAYGCHCVVSAALYCARRGSLHGLGTAETLRRHIVMEPEWPEGLRGTVGFALSVVCWITLFAPLYPLIEACLRPFRLSAFFYYYPNAKCDILELSFISMGRCLLHPSVRNLTPLL
jgi:hypothetical protein